MTDSRAAQCLKLMQRARMYGAAIDVEPELETRIEFGVVMAETLIQRACLIYDYIQDRYRRKLKGSISWAHHKW